MPLSLTFQPRPLPAWGPLSSEKLPEQQMVQKVNTGFPKAVVVCANQRAFIHCLSGRKQRCKLTPNLYLPWG